MKEYDFLVIGSGMAGLAAAKRGADLGARVRWLKKRTSAAPDSIAGASRKRLWSEPCKC